MNNVLTIEQVFAERLLRVPDYQRGYAWDAPQRGEFLEDLELLGAGKEHFTGTLVLHGVPGSRVLDDEGHSYATVHVVDGQQRLTTIVLLLDAIRRELTQFAPRERLVEGIRRTYIRATHLSGEPLYKLQLNADCDRFFTGSVLADNPGPEAPAIQSHHRLRDARNEFERFLAWRKRHLGDAYEPWLFELLGKVTQQLRLSVYAVSDDADVGVVFEVMNNRGKPLTELEKVKNYLLYLATKLDVPTDSLKQSINDSWAEIFTKLMVADLHRPDDEDQLLRAHWLMAHNPRTRDWSGSKSVKARFHLSQYKDKHKVLLADLRAYVDQLRNASFAYCDVMHPTGDHAFGSFDPKSRVDARALGQKLRRMGIIAPFLPLLLAIRLRFGSEPGRYIEMLSLCERFAFRVYKWSCKAAHAGRTKLLWVAHELFAGRIDFALAEASVRRELLRFSSNHDFDRYIAEHPPEDPVDDYRWNGLKYFLYEYEEHLAGGVTLQLPWSTLEGASLENSIEHILPQTPTDPYWTSRFDAPARKRYTHDFGNLSLTFHNQSYRNHAFPKKRGSPGAKEHCYAKSNLFMERALAGLDEWNADAIENRRAEIAVWAKNRWRVEPVPDDEQHTGQDEDDDDSE